jgi:hypothetical protein
MSKKINFFLAHSEHPADLEIIEQAFLRDHLKGLGHGGVEIVLLDRSELKTQEALEAALHSAHAFIHLVSPKYPHDDDFFYLDVVEAAKNRKAPAIPLIVFQANELKWRDMLFDGDKQQLLQDSPLADAPNRNNAAFQFAQKLMPLIQQLMAVLNGPRLPPSIIKDALFELDFAYQKSDFPNAFDYDKKYHLIAIQGSPECGHTLLLRHLRRMAGVRAKDPPLRVNLSVAPSRPAQQSVWEALSESLIPAAAREALLAHNINLGPVIGKQLHDMLSHAQSDMVAYIEFENNQQEALEKVRDFWREFNQLTPEQTPKGRLFFFVLDMCGNLQAALQPNDYAPTHPMANAVTLKPIEPLNKNALLGWLNAKFDEPAREKLEQVLLQLDELAELKFVRLIARKLCEWLYCPEIYQNLFEHES